MSAQSGYSLRSPRLILKAFTTDVDYRFFLLIFAIIGSSLYIFRAILVSIPLSAGYTQCVNGFLAGISAHVINAQKLSAQCSTPYLQLFQYLLLCEGLLFGIAILYYCLFPTLEYYRKKYWTLSEHKDPKIIAALEKLRQEYIPNVSKAHLHYVWKPSALEEEYPSVFGRLRRYYLFIPAAYVSLFRENPDGVHTEKQEDLEAFHIVMRHELSHLYNKDVNKTYFTLAIWPVFCGIALLPYVIFSLAIFWLYPGDGLSFAANGIWRVAAMALLVYLIRAAVLRSRELSADAQAIEWGDSVDMELQMEMVEPGKGIFRHYPTDEERRRNIEKPGEIFALKMLDALGTGIIFGMALPSIHDIFAMLNELFSNWTIDTTGQQVSLPDIGTTIVSILLTVLVGRMIWRAVLIARVHDLEEPRAGRFGLCLAIGILVGFFLSLYFTPFASAFSVSNWRIFVFYLTPWIFLLLIGLCYFCKWLALLASLWLEVVNERWVRRVIWLNLLGAGVFLVVVFNFFLQLLLQTLGFLQESEITMADISHPILQAPNDTSFYWLWRLIIQNFALNVAPGFPVLITFAFLWILPLFSRFWYRKKGLTKKRFQWARADEVAETVVPNPFHLLFAALIAVIGGLLFGGLLFFAHVSPFETPIAIGESGAAILVGPFLLSVGIGQLLLAALAQALLAAIIILRMNTKTRVIDGLFGAFLAAWLMTISTVWINKFMFMPVLLFEINWGIFCVVGIAFLIDIVRSFFQFRPRLMEELRLKIPVQWERRLLISICCLLIVGVLLLPSVVAFYQNRTNIVKDGDFESPVIVLDVLDQFRAGQSIGDWKVASGTVSLIGTYWVPAQGAQSMHLNGPDAGAISQDLSTQAGSDYTLSFAMSGDARCQQSLVTQMQVWWGTTLVATLSFDTKKHDMYTMGWYYHSYRVHATDAVTPLRFVSLTPATCGPALDNVTVTR